MVLKSVRYFVGAVLFLFSIGCYAQKRDHQQAVYLHSVGKTVEAGAYYIKALDAYEDSLGTSHPYLAVIKEQLALYCMDICLFDEALLCIDEAMKVVSNRPEHLGALHNTKGRILFQCKEYSKAKEQFTNALKLLPSTPLYNYDKFYGLKSLALCHTMLEEYEEAFKILEEVFNTIEYEEVSGPKPSLSDIVSEWEQIKHNKKATIPKERAFTQRYLLQQHSTEFLLANNSMRWGSGKDFSDYATMLFYKYQALGIKGERLKPLYLYEYFLTTHNIGNLYTILEEYEEAQACITEVHRVYKKEFISNKGLAHKYFFQDLTGTGHLYYSMIYTMIFSLDKPIYHFAVTEMFDLFEAIVRETVSLTENEQAALLSTYETMLHVFNGFMYNTDKEMAFNSVLMQKQIMQNNRDRIKLIQSAATQIGTDKYNWWRKLKDEVIQLSTLRNKTSKEIKKPIELYCLERTRLSEITPDERITKWEEITQALEADEIALEFFHNTSEITTSKDVDNDTITQLKPFGVFILTPQSKTIETIYLGKPSEDEITLNELVSTDKAYYYIWKPLEEKLAGYKKVYVSENWYLKDSSLAAVKTPTGYLCDKYEIYNITSVANIPEIKKRRSQSNIRHKHIALFGGMDYQLPPKILAGMNRSLENSHNQVTEELFRSMNSTERGTGFGYLPNSLTEVKGIDSLFTGTDWKSSLFTDIRATKSQFKTLSQGQSPAIIHVSTHGFFFNLPEATDENVYKAAKNPMLRNGLTFTGANQIWNSKTGASHPNEGILTAYEVSNMDLSGTELVVLAACKSGLGSSTGFYETAHGLERAFRTAGVRSLLISKKNVPDKETMEFMTLFYASLTQGTPIYQAFIISQRTMRHRYPKQPELWDAFVLIE